MNNISEANRAETAFFEGMHLVSPPSPSPPLPCLIANEMRTPPSSDDETGDGLFDLWCWSEPHDQDQLVQIRRGDQEDLEMLEAVERDSQSEDDVRFRFEIDKYAFRAMIFADQQGWYGPPSIVLSLPARLDLYSQGLLSPAEEEDLFRSIGITEAEASAAFSSFSALAPVPPPPPPLLPASAPVEAGAPFWSIPAVAGPSSSPICSSAPSPPPPPPPPDTETRDEPPAKRRRGRPKIVRPSPPSLCQGSRGILFFVGEVAPNATDKESRRRRGFTVRDDAPRKNGGGVGKRERE
ncbi:hypothetical protein I204_00274 [Kwoniella mangroviensis CBS 8886]|nr:hypothetical protein I204_00274 [Kwoniella mangroviensis CBS 8886]